MAERVKPHVFGVLRISRYWRVQDSCLVDGEGDERPESRQVWEDAEYEDEE